MLISESLWLITSLDLRGPCWALWLFAKPAVVYIRCGREDVNSHYYHKTFRKKVDVLALGKWVMKPEPHGHLSCFASLSGQYYELLSRSREEAEDDMDGDERIVTKQSEGKKKAVFHVKSISWPYTREAGNIMTNSFTRNFHHVSVCEKAVYFRRKGSSYQDMLSRVNYEGHSTVFTKHL